MYIRNHHVHTESSCTYGIIMYIRNHHVHTESSCTYGIIKSGYSFRHNAKRHKEITDYHNCLEFGYLPYLI
jgi:hypothetical protein